MEDIMKAKKRLKEAQYIEEQMKLILDGFAQDEKLREELGQLGMNLESADAEDMFRLSITKMDEQQIKALEKLENLLNEKAIIVSAIQEMENPVYRQILSKRYLKRERWEEIAFELGYVQRHIFRLHEKALAAIKFPDTSE